MLSWIIVRRFEKTAINRAKQRAKRCSTLTARAACVFAVWRRGSQWARARRLYRDRKRPLGC